MRLTHPIELAPEVPTLRVVRRRVPTRMHLARAAPERVADLGHARPSRYPESFAGLIERHEASMRYR